LPLHARKNRLKRFDFIDYFANERLKLQGKVVVKMLAQFSGVRAEWEAMIKISFLSEEMKEKYLDLLAECFARIF